MAVDNASATFLSGLSGRGVDATKTLTLGRQWLSADAETLERISRLTGREMPPAPTVDVGATGVDGEPPYADEFWAAIGAGTPDVLDGSSYEGARIVHDLNETVPKELHRKYSLVYDGGLLEHVFHFPNAVRNCMEMVAPGGHFAQINCANNYMGHGFYQFSPELLFRVFSDENGFEVRSLLLHERTPGGRWFLVQDPAEFGRRVELCNVNHTYFALLARRIDDRSPFANGWPQQSDYVTRWNGRRATGSSDPDRRGGFRALLPTGLKTVVRQVIPAAAPDPFAAPCYSAVSAEDVILGAYPDGFPGVDTGGGS